MMAALANETASKKRQAVAAVLVDIDEMIILYSTRNGRIKETSQLATEIEFVHVSEDQWR